jgi:hypothetical protein
LLGSIDIPPFEMMCPKKATCFIQNSHFLRVAYNLCS